MTANPQTVVQEPEAKSAPPRDVYEDVKAFVVNTGSFLLSTSNIAARTGFTAKLVDPVLDELARRRHVRRDDETGLWTNYCLS